MTPRMRGDLPFEVRGSAARPLGMAPARFLRDYWQKRPLLIRDAFPGYEAPLAPEDLAGLACEDGVLARLVRHDRTADRWQVMQGPIPESLFPTLGDRDWTLLVQDMDKWDADIAALVDAFGFLPRWRVDDVMVSFAVPGGSVGAHVDQYDVFLLQAMGHRRWQIDASEALGRGRPPADFRDDAELRLLRSFDATHDWVLGPGDMLYLPPGVPHNGVAEDACFTFSLGMRAPAVPELLGDYVDTLVAGLDEDARYADPDLAPARDPLEIDPAAMARVVDALNSVRMADHDALGDWFGRFITLYRAAVGPHGGSAGDPAALHAVLAGGGRLLRDPWVRVAWRRASRGARLFVAGQVHALPVADARRLAAATTLTAGDVAALSAAGRACLDLLFADGHYLVDDDGDAA
jgi:50S ribosomal protein L16 3-hydroxylase